MSSSNRLDKVCDTQLCDIGRSVLDSIATRRGTALNLDRIAAHAPAALRLLHSGMDVAESMQLDPILREALSLRVAQLNNATYCLSHHVEAARKLGVDDDTITKFRKGLADEPKIQALLALTSKILLHRGEHVGCVLDLARRQGVTDADIVETVAWIAVNNFTNYMSTLSGVEVDAPTRCTPDHSEST